MDIRIGTSGFTATFVEPMVWEIVSKLREGPEWVYEDKLDGYRAIQGHSANNAAFAGFIHGGGSEHRPLRCSRQPLSWALPMGTRRRFPLSR
jgi:hypothetical protein